MTKWQSKMNWIDWFLCDVHFSLRNSYLGLALLAPLSSFFFCFSRICSASLEYNEINKQWRRCKQSDYGRSPLSQCSLTTNLCLRCSTVNPSVRDPFFCSCCFFWFLARAKSLWFPPEIQKPHYSERANILSAMRAKLSSQTCASINSSW